MAIQGSYFGVLALLHAREGICRSRVISASTVTLIACPTCSVVATLTLCPSYLLSYLLLNSGDNPGTYPLRLPLSRLGRLLIVAVLLLLGTRDPPVALDTLTASPPKRKTHPHRIFPELFIYAATLPGCQAVLCGRFGAGLDLCKVLETAFCLTGVLLPCSTGIETSSPLHSWSETLRHGG